MQNAKRKLHNFFVALCILYCALFAGCSIPNLEPKACIDSRTAVREFYSFHFGNDMRFSQDNLKMRERFLTPDFASRLAKEPDGADLFTTGNTEFPKAFRVGSCREIAAERAEFQVLLFWKDDVRSEQREITAITAKQNDRWLIDNVTR